MTNLSHFSFKLDRFRRGQLQAFEVTTKRVMQDRESHTAIVLPTRYGKTDFMLLTGLYLMHQKAVSGVLIMTPNQVLRNQAVNTAKLNASLSRYEAVVERELPDGTRRRKIDPYNINDSPRIERLLGHAPLAATTSMVMQNLAVFRHWIDYLREKYGVPPIVFVDEAHTASNHTAWGNTIGELSTSGAYIVLCTATPYRSDGQPIPGFDVTTTYEEDLTRREQLGAHIYQVQGRRAVHMLTAHHTTTFQEAWQESVLCGISRETLDVNLREHRLDGYTEEWLSELRPSEARRALASAVRSEVVIRDGVSKLVRNLRTRQKDAPETAGIVFVGNDDGRDSAPDGDDAETNRYANMVAKAIREECDASPGQRQMKPVIATASVGDAAAVIESFSRGDGDILIVKMMASAGLDIARLKVALDLSTVRTAGSFVQRSMRICTRWERDGKGAIMKALYIAPDDCIGRELYQRLIHDLGGDASTVEWETAGELVDASDVPEAPRVNELTMYEAVGTRLGDILWDEDGTQGPGELLPVVDNFQEQLPITTREAGKGKLAYEFQAAVQEAARVLGGGTATPVQAPDPTPATPDTDDLVDNTQQRMEIKRKELVRSVKQYAGRAMQDGWGSNWNKDAPKGQMGLEINDAWNWLYEEGHIRWSHGMKSGQMLKSLGEADLDKLTRIMQEANNVAH